MEIEPCLNAGDDAILDRQVEALLRTGCRLFHLNVDEAQAAGPAPFGAMIGDVIVPLLRRYEAVLDVHVDGIDPASAFAAVAAAGASSVTFPFESGNVEATIGAARERGLQAGVSFAPDAEPEDVAAGCQAADLVLCLGTSGEAAGELPPTTFGRLRRLVRALPESARVQVEGGVGYDNMRELYDAGAKVFVVGDAIYEREDLPRAYRRLVQALA